MREKISNILESVFGYSEFRDLQEKVILNILDKEDTLGVMPTGSGKSLCYQIPSLVFEGMTVVVSPLISLMKDQVDQVREVGIEAAYLNSSLPREEYEQTVSDISQSRYKLLYVAPETLLTDRVMWLLRSVQISLITVDEAHCISEWGHDFRPEYRQLDILREKFPDAVILSLTATATKKVRKDISAILRIKPVNILVSSFNRPNLFLGVETKIDLTRQILDFINKFPDQSGIIYCATRKQVDDYTHRLRARGYSVMPYHAGLSDKQRIENQEKFARDDAQIMVATIAFGMGINKPNIRYILHTDLPKNIETYYQQIGRAGRDGEPAQCLLLFNYGDAAKIKYFFRDKGEDEQKHEKNLLQKMIGYCESDICRRKLLLNYFGEKYEVENCDNCDNCLRDEEEKEDLTIPAQKFLSCIWRTGQLFGANYIINVLRGSKESRIIENKHDQLSTYNIGEELSKMQWLELSSKLLSAGIIRRDPMHGSLLLTDMAWKILKGETGYRGRLQPERQSVKITPDDLEYNFELFQILRELRKKLADERNVPPYVILPDKSLKELAFYYPQSIESLMTMHGFGEKKCKTYAGDFIPIIIEYAEIHGKKEIKKISSSQKKYRYQEVGEMFNSGKSIPEITEHFDVSENTIIKHLETCIELGYDLERDLLKTDGIEKKENFQEIINKFKEKGCQYLKPVFDAFMGSISYEELDKAKFVYLLQSQMKSKIQGKTNEEKLEETSGKKKVFR